MSTLGLVLAAGASVRAGQPKALHRIDDETLLARTLRVLREGGAVPSVVVVGPPHAPRLETEASEARVVHNPEPYRGMLSSAKLGVSAVLEVPDATGAVLALIDHPHVGADTIARLVMRAREDDVQVVRPVHAGRRGHPLHLSRTALMAIVRAPVEARLNEVLQALSRVDLPVDDPGVLEDLDTAEELATAGVRAPSPQA